MSLSDVYLGLGRETFDGVLRHVSIGKLKTYGLYDRMKLRLGLNKLSSETLRRSAPRIWTRLEGHDDEFASELAQAVLIAHMDLVKAVLDHLGVPHQEGFFEQDLDPAPYFKEGWKERAYDEFKDHFPRPVLLFYLNHLGHELNKEDQVFVAA